MSRGPGAPCRRPRWRGSFGAPSSLIPRGSQRRACPSSPRHHVQADRDTQSRSATRPALAVPRDGRCALAAPAADADIWTPRSSHGLRLATQARHHCRRSGANRRACATAEPERTVGSGAYLSPPATRRFSPVTQCASSEARKTATGAMSSGWPMRASGVKATNCRATTTRPSPALRPEAVSPGPKPTLTTRDGRRGRRAADRRHFASRAHRAWGIRQQASCFPGRDGPAEPPLSRDFHERRASLAGIGVQQDRVRLGSKRLVPPLRVQPSFCAEEPAPS